MRASANESESCERSAVRTRFLSALTSAEAAADFGGRSPNCRLVRCSLLRRLPRALPAPSSRSLILVGRSVSDQTASPLKNAGQKNPGALPRADGRQGHWAASPMRMDRRHRSRKLGTGISRLAKRIPELFGICDPSGRWKSSSSRPSFPKLAVAKARPSVGHGPSRRSPPVRR